MKEDLQQIFKSTPCSDVWQQVYERVKAEGGTDLKARNYAEVARRNCEAAGPQKGPGDPK